MSLTSWLSCFRQLELSSPPLPATETRTRYLAPRKNDNRQKTDRNVARLPWRSPPAIFSFKGLTLFPSLSLPATWWLHASPEWFPRRVQEPREPPLEGLSPCSWPRRTEMARVQLPSVMNGGKMYLFGEQNAEHTHGITSNLRRNVPWIFLTDLWHKI